ncbi:MAG: SRPBCC family protein [Gemmataceae bacterium]
MLYTILIVIAAVVLALVGFIAMRRADFCITRSATMSAPPAAVFAQVNDFHNWDAWSPWAKLDPNMKQTYEGAPAGTGAVYMWNGDNKVGEGRMTILESQPSHLIRIKLEFMRPFAATNISEFTFKPEDNKTVVTWSMSGRHNFMAKAFMLFMNMDKMVGGDFEKGLASMKAIVEGVPQA